MGISYGFFFRYNIDEIFIYIIDVQLWIFANFFFLSSHILIFLVNFADIYRRTKRNHLGTVVSINKYRSRATKCVR